ncbi:unnamed protein product, partial [Mesorhabditis belari]|uniref:Arf-GAP domain-containing protein n=1 Tax=Mesorhabditis belari TaxID=2138241 RepID=A0AAF3E8I4_9BILA
MSGPVHVNPTIFSKDKGISKKADPKKEESERLQKILLELLKEEENKYCADCQAKSPRWAAWNLGVYICIRCAGLHRNLGVHISKVRSINLDSWSVDQVHQLESMGNERARTLYEACLPEGFRRPATSDQQMEQFIRAKYEQKRYYPRDGKIPPPREPRRIAVSSNGQSIVKQSEPIKQQSLLDFSSPDDSPAPNSSAKPNLFDQFDQMKVSTPQSPDDPFGEFVSASSEPVEGFANFAVNSTADTNTASLLPSFDGDMPTISTPSNLSGAADLFGVFSAPASASVPTQETSVPSVSNSINDGQRSNADILALFSVAPTQSFTAPPLGGFSATAYGLSQFGNLSDTSQIAAKQQNVAQLPSLMSTMPNVDVLSSLSMCSLPQNNLQQQRSSTGPPMQMHTQNFNNPPQQTRAMKAFDGIDKDMFMMASGSKKPSEVKENASMSILPGKETTNTLAPVDLLDLF